MIKTNFFYGKILFVVCLVQFKILLFAVSFLLCVARSIAVKDKIKANKKS